MRTSGAATLRGALVRRLGWREGGGGGGGDGGDAPFRDASRRAEDSINRDPYDGWRADPAVVVKNTRGGTA